MATDTTNIEAGAAVVSVGAWVTAGGAGSLTDVGHMKGPVTLTPSREDYDIKSERAFGVLKKIPQDSIVKIKINGRVDHHLLEKLSATNLRRLVPNTMNVSLSFPSKFKGLSRGN